MHLKQLWIWTWMHLYLATYIKNEVQKLDIYKRIAGIESEGGAYGYAGGTFGSLW